MAKDRKWIIYVDCSSTKKHGGARVVLITLDEDELSSALRLKFKITNNKAEYEAIIAGLRMTLKLGAKSVEVRSNS